jgi:opacity protein-like surface antigen
MRRTTMAMVGIVVVLLAPSVASAQGYLIPFAGGNFGGDTGTTLDQSINDTSRLVFGARLGGMSHGVFGAETDIGYTRNFYGTGSIFNSSNLLTVMANLLVGLPAGPMRPYATGGVGIIRRNIDVSSLESVASFADTQLAYNIGGGVNILLSRHVGINGDFRHFRNFGTGNSFLDLTDQKFNFTRVSVGLVLQF